MNGNNPFVSLSKYSLVITLSLLLAVQVGHCYKNQQNGYPEQEYLRRQNYNDDNSPHYDDAYSSTNISSRDLSATASIPKPGGIVAYHRSIHNTSWAITIPLFSFVLPTANVHDPVNIGNQALYGFFAAVIVIIGFSIPILFNGHVPGARSLENNKVTLNHLLHPGHLVNLVGLNIGNQIGIDPMQCMQKTVCEAYRSPQNEKYGGLVLPFQYFFPARNVSASEAGARSIYELAARDGKFTRTDCKKKYECMFDVLDLATYCLSMYKRSRKRGKDDDDSKNENYPFNKDFSSDKLSYR